MKKLTFIILITLLTGCKDTVTKEDLPLLNGYWEISEVIFEDGNSKSYKASSTIDFFKVDGLKGLRKKVQPNIGGSFNTNNDSDILTIYEKNGTFILNYKNDFTQREEQILSLTKDSFSVKDQEQTTYIYLRYKPIEFHP
ncbi:hypothetical protein MWU65_10545 [Cellulophaga sp. F20128]|uniref:hypothetical protein n=1 Tax=Cellulophaga sp. F20128 TaxID=2926413 RepID=UPI001FF2717A|nr:hypothetical protein [Cellulophaga sp. F20128]MCK0157620.1 hypothetical protein [Cellulophaga sp. F20128]